MHLSKVIDNSSIALGIVASYSVQSQSADSIDQTLWNTKVRRTLPESFQDPMLRHLHQRHRGEAGLC